MPNWWRDHYSGGDDLIQAFSFHSVFKKKKKTRVISVFFELAAVCANDCKIAQPSRKIALKKKAEQNIDLRQKKKLSNTV